MNHFADIGKNMIIADKYFKRYLRETLEPYGINAAEGMVLMMMYKKKKDSGNTQDELIKEIHYDKGVMTRTMKALEEKGFVGRMQNPDDSRSFVFSLTDKALDFKQILIAILKQWEKQLLEGIDKDTLKVVEGVLESMAQNSIAYFDDKKTQR